MLNPFPKKCARAFSLQSVLGRGGGGVTYLATQASLGRPAVIKLPCGPTNGARLTPVETARFRLEARLTAALSHPHVITVLDHDVEDGQPWIAYEFLPGRDLQQVVHEGPLPVRVALEVCRQAAAALEHAHAHDVLHRDVKPSNIMEAGPGRYKLIDFGLAHVCGRRARTTLSEGVAGTPSYLAPEQVEGRPATVRTDVYALGATLYELLTGSCPFVCETLFELVRQIVSGPVPALVPFGIPGRVDRIVRRAMAKDPESRFESMAGMRAALEDALRAGSLRRPPSRAAATTAPLAPPVVVPTPRSTGQAMRWTFAVLLAVSLAMGVSRSAPVRPVSPEESARADRVLADLAPAEAELEAIAGIWATLAGQATDPALEARAALALVTRGLARAEEGRERVRAARAALARVAERDSWLSRANTLDLALAFNADALARARQRLRRIADSGDALILPELYRAFGAMTHSPAMLAPVVRQLDDVLGVLRTAARDRDGAARSAPVIADLERLAAVVTSAEWHGVMRERFEEASRRFVEDLAALGGPSGKRIGSAAASVWEAYRLPPGNARRTALARARDLATRGGRAAAFISCGAPSAPRGP